VMENDGAFNAGYGSSLNIERSVEMDASIMDGRTLEAGAVALVKDIKNPIRLARIVMEETDHVLVAGEGAEKLAKSFNLERVNPVTDLRLKYYEDQKKAFLEGKGTLVKNAEIVKTHPDLCDTVGGVAIDTNGNLAAATSTGGYPLKLVGRIGDSATIGAGTYADNLCGACSATGVGEIAMRLVLAKLVCDRIACGETAQDAVDYGIQLVNKRIARPNTSMGLVAIDIHGSIGAAHNSANLCWAYLTTGMEEPAVSLTAKIVKGKI